MNPGMKYSLLIWNYMLTNALEIFLLVCVIGRQDREGNGKLGLASNDNVLEVFCLVSCSGLVSDNLSNSI